MPSQSLTIAIVGTWLHPREGEVQAASLAGLDRSCSQCDSSPGIEKAKTDDVIETNIKNQSKLWMLGGTMSNSGLYQIRIQIATDGWTWWLQVNSGRRDSALLVQNIQLAWQQQMEVSNDGCWTRKKMANWVIIKKLQTFKLLGPRRIGWFSMFLFQPRLSRFLGSFDSRKTNDTREHLAAQGARTKQTGFSLCFSWFFDAWNLLKLKPKTSENCKAEKAWQKLPKRSGWCQRGPGEDFEFFSNLFLFWDLPHFGPDFRLFVIVLWLLWLFYDCFTF